MPSPHPLPWLLTLFLNFTEKIKALNSLPPHAPHYSSPTSSICTHTLLPPVTGAELTVLLSKANPCIWAGVLLSTYSKTRIFSLLPVSPFSRFSPGSFPSVHTRAHTRAAISPVFKNTSLTSLASLITTPFICPLYRRPPKEVLELFLVLPLPFLPEPAPIRLLFPHSTKTAIRKATRSSLGPNPLNLHR